MTPETPEDLVIAVKTPDQLFNAPTVNPFSTNELEILGMSGMAYIVRQLQAHKRDWKRIHLRVRIPPDEITPGFEPRLVEATHRYCRAKIADNRLEIRLIRFRSSVGLGLLLVVVAVIIAIAYLLFIAVFADTPQALKAVIAATISLFAWVSLWDPLEALIFEPIALMRENFVLRRITELAIIVEPARPSSPVDEAVSERSLDGGVPLSPRP